ncbi:MAG: hypothetical protein GXO55_09230 [Chloroflexi bacterium]|nr:hypothetical protein [Chloroflexota bacterium]
MKPVFRQVILLRDGLMDGQNPAAGHRRPCPQNGSLPLDKVSLPVLDWALNP